MNFPVSKRRRIFLTLLCLAPALLAWQAFAQTRINLAGQSANVDFSQFSLTRPVKQGTVLPSSCTTADLFFKTDAAAGSNLYLCASSAWYAITASGGGGGGVGGATSLNGLTDLKVSTATTAVSVAAGRFQYLDSSGRYTVTDIQAATVTKVSGSDTGTMRIEIDPASGTPIIRCLFESTMTVGNYSASGCTTGTQNQFSAGAQPLATVVISGGVWGNPTDLRVLSGTANYLAGTGLSKAGNTFSVNPGVVGLLSAINTWTARQNMTAGTANAGLNVGSVAGDPASVSNGDIWYNSTTGKLRCRQSGSTVNCADGQLPAENESTGLTGDPAAITILAGSHPAGTYRLCGTVSVTTAGSGAFSAWTVSWRDPSNPSDVTRTIAWDDNGTFTTTPGAAVAAPASAVCKTLRSTGVSPISVNPGNGGTALFNLYFTAERIQ